MKVEHINPFLEAAYHVLSNFGFSQLKRGNVRKKNKMYVNMDVTSVIGLIGSVTGKIAYSFSADTAHKFASTMTGENVSRRGADVRNAIAELSNMITGNGCKKLSSNDMFTDFTVPSIVSGEKIYFLISPVEALSIEIETDMGIMELNIGFENQ